MHGIVRALVTAVVLLIATEHVAAARQLPPQTSPTGPCGDCEALERALKEEERKAAETRAKLPDLDRQIQSATAQYELGQKSREALQAKVKAGTAPDNAADTLRAYDRVLEDYARRLDALRRERQELTEQLARETDRAGRFRAALEACKKQPCPSPPGGGSGGDTNTTGGTPVTPVMPDLDPIPECEPCRPSAEAIEKWEKEVEAARAEVEKLELQDQALDAMIRLTEADEQRVRDRIAAGGAGKEWDEALQEIIRRKLRTGANKAGHIDKLDEARGRLKSLLDQGPTLEDALDKCNESCPMPDPKEKKCEGSGCDSLWSDKRVWGTIGGAVLGGFLIANGSGDAPTANVTPTGSLNPNPAPNPNPNPAPAPAPMPEPTPAPPPPPPPRTTADGIYRCVEVVVVSDEGRHNGTINLGPQLTGNFDVREGSITIRHPAPFVDIVGAQFDTASGAFSGTAIGPVAGSPTVGVRADGTVTTSTGRIVFNYAMGTGGELPGGRPIVYRITLQKQ